jgi:monovalent cation:proton antiporter-2 (CPA2) family protein
MVSTYLTDVIILLIAAVVAVPFFQALRLGAVPGFLVAGVIVGPYGFSLIKNTSDIGHLAEIGVVFLLFVIGIELKPSRLWQMKRMVFGLGTLQVIVTGLIIGSIAFFIFDVSLRVSLLIGPALALSSTAFVLQILSEQKLLTSSYGRISIAVLLMQDLAVVPLLALVPLLVLPELSLGADIGLALIESIMILTLVVLLGRYLLHPVLHRVAVSGSSEIFTASAVLIVLGTAVMTEHAGLSMAMGAFLAGLLISDSAFKHQIMAEIQPFRGLLLGLFFVYMGMSLNIRLLFADPLPALGLVVLLVVIKILVLFPLAYSFRLQINNSLAASLVLGQSGEFALVLFTLAHQSDLLNDNLFQQLLLIVLLSMLSTPLLAYFAVRLVKKSEIKKTDVHDEPVAAPIVIAGFGRVGRRIGEILKSAGKSYVALDADATVVDSGRAMGCSVFYGDVRKPEILTAAGASHAKIIVVTLNDYEATEQVVTSLRQSYPDMEIYARGRSLGQCRKLQQLGATGVISENIEASLELAGMVLNSTGLNEELKLSILNEYRNHYREQISQASGN